MLNPPPIGRLRVVWTGRGQVLHKRTSVSPGGSSVLRAYCGRRPQLAARQVIRPHRQQPQDPSPTSLVDYSNEVRFAIEPHIPTYRNRP